MYEGRHHILTQNQQERSAMDSLLELDNYANMPSLKRKGTLRNNVKYKF